MTATRNILQRLLAEIERFESGKASLPDLQGAILGHGHAVDLGNPWRDLVDRVEGAIDQVRFTVPPDGQAAAVKPFLDELRGAAQRAITAAPGA